MKADFSEAHLSKEFEADGPLLNCRFAPDGTHVYAASEDRKIYRWNLESGERSTFVGHDSWVRGLAFSKDGQTLLSGGFDDTLIWWSAVGADFEPIRTVKGHAGWIRALDVSPQGQCLASAGNDRVVRLWSVSDGALLRELQGHERDVYSVFFHPEGEFLLTGDLMGNVHQWEVETGKRVRSFHAQALHTYNGGQQVDYGGVRSIALTPAGDQLICAGLHKATNPLGAVSEPIVLRLDWDSQELVQSHVGEGIRGIAWRAMVHPDNFLFGCSGGGGGGYLLFWNAAEEKDAHRLKLPNTAREMDLHPDGLRIATAHHDKKVRLSLLTKKPASQ